MVTETPPVGRSAGPRVGLGTVPMTPTDIACGWVTGSGTSAQPARRRAGPTAVIKAMEGVIRPALARPPCLVELSGGRDSSAVLAVAVRLARREALPLPVAVTQRVAGVDEADERSWQEQVVQALGVEDWECQELDDELDLVGPVAAPSLRRHGVLWPPLAHTRRVSFAGAVGGSVVTGEGGDELFGARRITPVRQVAGRVVPLDRRSLCMAMMAVAPTPARRAHVRALLAARLEIPWLRPAARRSLLDRLADDMAREPLDWRRAASAHLSSPTVSVAVRNLAALAAEADVHLVHPFLEPHVVEACGAMAGPFGVRDRTSAMGAVFEGLLPEAVLHRRSKARFNRAVFHRHSRQFVERFTGAGVPGDLVDEDALVAAWKAEEPSAMSFALLQWCWLAASAPEVPGS